MSNFTLRTTAGLTVKPSKVRISDRTLPPGLDHLWNRPYQAQTLLARRELVKQGATLRDPRGKPLLERGRIVPRILIGGPTGSGKGTMIAASVAMTLHENPLARIVVAAPRFEIADDIHRRVSKLGIESGLNFRSERAVQIGTIQTLVSRQKNLPVPDLLILDEGHHMRSNTWESVISSWSSSELIGFTATTLRADRSELGDIYDLLIESCNYSDLLAMGGILVDCDLYQPKEPLGPNLALSPVDAYNKFARGPTLVFERSAWHAKETLRECRDAGIQCEIVLESTGRKERKNLLGQFARGEIPILITVEVLTEGIDLPNATTVILLKPISHLSRYKQIVGRILRYCEEQPDKRALVIDLIGTSRALKAHLPTDDYPYELSLTQSRLYSGGHNDNKERGELPEAQILGLPMFDARNGEEVRPRRVVRSAGQNYLLQLKKLVRAGKLTSQLAEARYLFRFGVCPPDLDFR